MTDGPVAKKFRIWNPAVSELSENQAEPANNLQTQDEESTDEKPLDCTAKNTQMPFPEIFQNYLQLAPLMIRLQQQRQMEELARRQFLSTFCHVVPPAPAPPIPSISSIPMPTGSTSSSSSSSTSSSSSCSTSSASVVPINPIVATALGNQVVNENCCAVCGAVFRLTGDLVQHMRNNHRKSKFKRKADLRQ
ncbi:unnamed protein product [Caenorhabditis sp. 36 PRJEB53466]|nr:unnamed protein product [Caenorhabditis sp. 36 PRJEB53466]